MIKEIIQFMERLDDDFKALAYKPSPGLHIIVDIDSTNTIFIDHFLHYDGDAELSQELKEIAFYEKNSSYISMNQQQKFDTKQKIHSASPFSLAFNFSLGSKKKEILTMLKKEAKTIEPESKKIPEKVDELSKKYKIDEVRERISDYFSNAQKLCLQSPSISLKEKLDSFELFCTNKLFEELPNLSMQKNTAKNKSEPKYEEKNILKELKEKDYIRVYLKASNEDVSKKSWEESYRNYYEKEYPPNQLKDNDFLTTYSQKKPFNIHQTATFDSNKINGKEIRVLQEFKNLLAVKPQRILPLPLPIFVLKEELQEDVIRTFKASGYTLSYQEIIKKLWDKYKHDLGNYYLLYWTRGKEMFKDFDFVSKFEYELNGKEEQRWKIENLFDSKDNETKSLKNSILLTNIFELEHNVFKILLSNKYNQLDYFNDLDTKGYEELKNTFFSYSKYRKSTYDYIYKAQRKAISIKNFEEMVFNSIKDEIKNDKKTYNKNKIKDKLNIWFSLYEKFNPLSTNTKTMASKLKNYQEFVEKVATPNSSTELDVSSEYFAFAAGQVIYYILQKSKSDDNSYRLLEPYLQQSNCEQFKIAISKDFARYKHENFSNKFERVAAFVLTYETQDDLKKYLPEILAGVFSRNQLFSNNNNNN